MRYRQSLLLAPEDLGPSGTKIISLANISQPISRIEVRFKTTKVLYQMTAPGPANIPRIELISGSTPLHSLTGYENQALAYYSTPNISMEHGQHIQTQSEVDLYHLNFGRYLYDPALAFLANKFISPQLQIQWDEDVADTSVTVNEMEVWLHLFDERQITPIGFLSALEQHPYTCGAANSYEEFLLPADRVIRQLLVRAYRDGYEPWTTLGEARLDENNEAHVPFNITDLEDYYRRYKAVHPPIETPIVVEPYTSGRVYYVPQSDYWATIVFTNVAANQDVYISGTDMKGGKATLLATANGQAVGIARGYLPWHCYQFPMGSLADIDDWYNPTGRAPRLRLRAGSNGTNGTVQTVVEQLYRY